MTDMRFFPVCAECCKDGESSPSCKESTPHTSSISPTETCPLLANDFEDRVSKIVSWSRFFRLYNA